MVGSKIIIASALCLPLIAYCSPSLAATAHNAETGAHTKNSADTAADANMKQMHMRKHMRRHKM